MAEKHEELLLNELLGDLARESAREDASHLEARVLREWSVQSLAVSNAAPRARPRRALVVCAIAATVVLAVASHRFVSTGSRHDVPAVAGAADAQHAEPAVTRAPRLAKELTSTLDTPHTVEAARLMSDAAPRPAPVRKAEPVMMEFVPLTPMSPEEMTGTFQIVRVQMPRASLGALAPPVVAGPNDLIETEVLLGEDGMARAIRVATQTPYPWRNR